MKGKRSILIVDDEPDILSALELYLTLEGFEVSTAFDAQEALKHLERLRPDLLLFDVMMPGMTGLELLLLLRNRKEFKKTPAYIMSAGSVQAKKEDYNWSALIRKPFDFADLLKILKREH
jgi:DNA-binding response OmpR family regulator